MYISWCIEIFTRSYNFSFNIIINYEINFFFIFNLREENLRKQLTENECYILLCYYIIMSQVMTHSVRWTQSKKKTVKFSCGKLYNIILRGRRKKIVTSFLIQNQRRISFLKIVLKPRGFEKEKKNIKSGSKYILLYVFASCYRGSVQWVKVKEALPGTVRRLHFKKRHSSFWTHEYTLKPQRASAFITTIASLDENGKALLSLWCNNWKRKKGFSPFAYKHYNIDFHFKCVLNHTFIIYHHSANFYLRIFIRLLEK